MRFLPLISCLALAAGQLAADGPVKKLNLLLILADDCTKYDTEAYGGQARTPNLMRLAGEGMTFTQCFQAAPTCSPTRHALYTSKYPVKTGAHPNHTFVKEGITSVFQWLKDAGYRAALSGKTHVNPPQAFPFEYLANTRGGKINRNQSNPEFAEVDKFLDECVQSGTPFGLFLCSNEPHSPWNKGDPSAYPPEKLVLPPIWADTPATRSDFSRYLAEITYFDDQVGQALSLLAKHGLAENTLVIVLTEQGNSFPFAKWTCYDVGLGSGLIVRWPGRVKPGSRSDALVEYIDVMPTFFAAAGLSSPGDIDGFSFLNVLTGASAQHKEHTFGLATSRGIFHGPEHYGIRSVRDARYRYILNLTPEATFKNTTTRDSTFKEWIVAGENGDARAASLARRYQHRPAEEFYDCLKDPWNLHNLAADPSHRDRIDALRKELAAWMESQGDRGQETEMSALDRMWKGGGDN